MVFPNTSESYEKQSTKDIIIGVLGKEWPLSAKEIYAQVNKLIVKPISYQAVHKTIKELAEHKILMKRDKDYCLSISWIKKLKDFSINLENAYLKKDQILSKDLWKKNHVDLCFEVPINMGKFLINNFFYWPSNKKPTIASIYHNYPLLGLSKREIFAMVRHSLSRKWFVMTQKKSVVDKIFAKPYQRIGIKFKLGIPRISHGDVFIVGDYVCHIYWPKGFLNKWDRWKHKMAKRVSGFDLQGWFDIAFTKTDGVYVVIDKNAVMANAIREKVLSYF